MLHFLQILQMDELSCFVPGMLSLGSLGYGLEDAEKFLSLAEEVHFLSILKLRSYFILFLR